jgi:hypothetical protein
VEVRTETRRELTLELDRDNLAAIGRTTVREYAARMGISEHAAKVRLRAVYDAGYATRHIVPTLPPTSGRQPWVYVAAQGEGAMDEQAAPEEAAQLEAAAEEEALAQSEDVDGD